ncbi:hypothetical protein GYMLUDRAFT_236313 [Collybiopsis luxurians FD-317 M1]|nr:hypothetical protein GYMLUDRAFT_236313 [Collybiopsis luxurians FD-317 M1]
MAPKLIRIESDDELDALAPHTVSSSPPKSSLSAKAQGKQPAHSKASAALKVPLFCCISSLPCSDTQEQVRSAAEEMEQVVEQYRRSEITVMDAFCAIKHSTSDATVAKDYIDKILQIQ